MAPFRCHCGECRACRRRERYRSDEAHRQARIAHARDAYARRQLYEQAHRLHAGKRQRRPAPEPVERQVKLTAEMREQLRRAIDQRVRDRLSEFAR